jgi:hypothetical protein
MPRMLTRRLVWLAAVVQFGAVAVLRWGHPPYGMYAQVLSLVVMLAVFGAFGIQRFRFLRANYKKSSGGARSTRTLCAPKVCPVGSFSWIGTQLPHEYPTRALARRLPPQDLPAERLEFWNGVRD